MKLVLNFKFIEEEDIKINVVLFESLPNKYSFDNLNLFFESLLLNLNTMELPIGHQKIVYFISWNTLMLRFVKCSLFYLQKVIDFPGRDASHSLVSILEEFLFYSFVSWY